VPTDITIQIAPEEIGKEEVWKRIAARKLRVRSSEITHHQLLRRSIDARGRKTKYVLRMRLWMGEAIEEGNVGSFPLQNVSQKSPIHIIGFGSAGVFAALECIRQGYKPIVIERGKDVRARRRDLAQLTRHGEVNPESNYCFGEGGAGTFSDGKLYTRSTKRGDTQRVLETLVQFGADPDILIDAHPHIGTNKLPGIIQNMREAVIEAGGEVRFSTKLTDIRYDGSGIQAIQLNRSAWESVKHLILATGHSARDIFELLHRREILIEAKPFALGVRVEHPQEIIDQIQYHVQGPRSEFLPAASYSLVQQVDAKGVYSFCMCPGGIICPAATAPGELVVNGWSPSKRNSPYANSGMVVEVGLNEMHDPLNDPLAGLKLQQMVEQATYQAGGGKQVAPAQRLYDFVKGKTSQSLPACSYIPGLNSVEMGDVLPQFIHRRLQGGFKAFGKKMKGYLSNEALVVATESRTSSPVRIPRERETFAHPQLANLYPCAEGAGYAGGIMSAAIDGQKCVRAAVGQPTSIK